MALQLVNGSAAKSASFSARLSALPDELKLIIIGHAVTFGEYKIDLQNYHLVREAHCSKFNADDHLLAMAHEQFDHVNFFRMSPTNAPTMFPAGNIADLEVNFTITCEGGNFDNENRFPLPAWDIANLEFIPEVYKHLERLTIIVDNSGKIANGSTYSQSGHQFQAAAEPDAMAVERIQKMHHWIQRVSSFPLPQWRRNLKVKTRLVFNNRGGRLEGTLAARQCQDPTGLLAHDQYLAYLFALHDEPISVVYFDGDEFW